MPITPNQPAAITRYFSRGTTQVLWCTSISNPAAPTFSELDNGTEVGRDLADWGGWEVSTNFIETPDLATRYTSKLPGVITSPDAFIVFYADKSGNDLRALMPKDTIGFIVVADGGLATAKGDVFKVQVASVPKQRSFTEATRLRFSYAVLQEPNENVTLPQS
jgi:hypothetical protein